jgi:hypothetical protein
MKKIIAAAGIFSILCFPCFATEKLNHNDLKKVTGQAGIVFELGELTVKIKYGELTYTDTDGYGSITRAGIKVISDTEGSTLYFKPIDDFEKYSNANLRKEFGDQIGDLGLKENLIENHNAEINRKDREEKDKDKSTKEKGVTFSHLVIETSSYCSLLTAIGLFNSGIIGLTKDQAIERNLNTGGIIARLPSVEATTGHSTKSIVVFTDDPNMNSMNNNKPLLTIEKGPATQAILGGTVEITPIKSSN